MEKIGDRRLDLDWLRVLAMLNIFLFHSGRFFNYEDWSVKNNQLSTGFSAFIDVVAFYIMPLFFIISAQSSYYSLGRRSEGAYMLERVKRLAVPLVFGVFVVIAPIQVWIERVTHPPGYAESFLHFQLHDYFHGLYMITPHGNFAWMGLHLWYLLVLFLFSIITLPLFIPLARGKGAGVIALLGRLASRRGGVYAFILPVFVIEMIVNQQPDGIGSRSAGGWSLLSYLVFFIIGYLLTMDPAFREALVRERRVSLAAALIFTSIFLGWIYGEMFTLQGDADYLARCLLRSAMSWSCLAAILGYGARYLNFQNRFLKYANQAVLPFYILHQTVIVCVGWIIRDWDLGVGVKALILIPASFAIIMLIYELAVRRLPPLRFLFGMKATA